MAIRANQVALSVWNEPGDAYFAMKDALMSIGSVTEQDETERFLLGTARHRLQRVEIAVRVAPLGQGSEVRVRAQGDNMWGRGRAAKSVARRLLARAEGGILETWR